MDDDSAFWIALGVCLLMIVLIWPRQMPPAWKYDKSLICDYGTCVNERATKFVSPKSDEEYLRAKIRKIAP